MRYVGNYIYGLMKTSCLWINKAENQNRPTTFSEGPYIEYQQAVWNDLWDTLKSPLWPLLNKALLWVNISKNWKFSTNFSGKLWGRILTICVKQFKGYMKSHFKVVGKLGFTIPIWLKIRIFRQCFVKVSQIEYSDKKVNGIHGKDNVRAHVHQAVLLISKAEIGIFW
jgi:hypothetical protein